MKAKPKTAADLKDFESQCNALTKHIRKHWDNLDCRPKGYAEFTEDYEDYSGMEEWDRDERPAQEKAFKGFDDATAGSFNFVAKTALPHVAYDDLYQGRDPLNVLIGACMSYGFAMGELHGYDRGYERGGIDQMLKSINQKHPEE